MSLTPQPDARAGPFDPPIVDVAAPPATDPSSFFSPAYRRYALYLLTSIYVVNFIDRQIINIVAEPVKLELHLSDAQLGLMTGLAFALFYTLLGLPIAQLAERWNRSIIIAVCVGVWSACTVACGLAQNFTQLILGRMGVGCGEAGGTPAAHSLITDHFPRERRARALATFAMGNSIGALTGLLVGGLIAGRFGWRAVFWVAGIPGLVLAIVTALTLREPRKLISGFALPPLAGFGATLRILRSKPTFRLVVCGSAMGSFFALAHGAFVASFFLRNHADELARLGAQYGLSPLGFLGITLGVTSGIGGAIGTILGGVFADRFGASDPRAYLVAPAIGALLLIPIYIAALLVSSAPLALGLLMVTTMLTALSFGPVWATVQGISPPHVRATASAIQLLTNNLVGLGGGPLFIGFISDLFSMRLGLGSAEGIRWALIVASFSELGMFALLWRTRRHIVADFHA